ncbi:MAG: Lrp/AsnC ligand binding domain-containing protein [Chloroflexi bacterium]|nr:Lrp/AsnC ligand binding domain-containing protein [Chloroflexota bacterium]
MELKVVLQRVEGVNKRFVHYLESQSYIQPLKIRKQRIARRDYREEDVRRIRDIWRYYRRGFSIQSAYQLAVEAERSPVYLLLQTPGREVCRAIEVLRGFDQVVEAAAVYAESIDLIVQAEVPEENEIYELLSHLVRQVAIQGAPRILKAQPAWSRLPDQEEKGMLAYVLIKMPAKQIEEVLEQLKAYDGIVEATVVYGESDVIARVEVAQQAELDRLVMEQIHRIPAVESTRTFIAVGGLHWQR